MKINEYLKAAIPNIYNDGSNTVRELECFSYFGSNITNDARGTREIKSRIAVAKAAFNKKALSTNKLGLNSGECYIWSITLYGAEMWTLRKVGQKYLANCEMWCWRRMEKISWTGRVRNEEVLLHKIKRMKAYWIGYIWRRNCFLKHVIEGKKEGRI